MINKSVNQFTKGLNTSSVKTIQPKDTYFYALNAVKEDSTNNPSVITNEKGFTNYIDLGYNYILLGSIYLGKEDYVLFINDENNTFNRILLVQNKVITTLYDTLDLGFNTSYVIRGTYRINYKNQRVIYWVDGLNEDRVLNIDNGLQTGDIDELALDIKYVPAVLTSRQLKDTGGSLKTGTYEFFAAYKSKDNAVTPWFILTANPIYVIDDSIEGQSDLDNVITDGSDSGISTSKSIDLTISNLDNRYNNLRIGVIKTYNQVSTAYYVDNVSYNSSTKTYTYTGSVQEVLIEDISELLIDRVRYYGSHAITQTGNRLLRANTKSARINIDYQSYANDIIVDYYIQEELAGTQNVSDNYNTKVDWWKSMNTKYTDSKSLLRDEVYSLGIAFGLKKEGLETEVFHIPGRAINNIPNTIYETPYNDIPSDTPSTNWDTRSITENGETVPRWKVYDTAAKSIDNSVKKLGYYESIEKYPDSFNYPILGSSNTGINNTNIRHHKMPSAALEPIFRRGGVSGVDDTATFYKRNLGLSFNNINIPPELRDNISYIRIYISSRLDESNKSIIAKGILANCSLTKINTTPGNISSNKWVMPCQPYNDQSDSLNDATFIGNGDFQSDTHYYSLISPDTSFRKPNVVGSKLNIEGEYRGGVNYFNTIASKIDYDPYIPTDNGAYNPANNRDSSSNGGYKRDFFFGDNKNGEVMEAGQNSTSSIYNVIDTNNFRSTYKSDTILNEIYKVSNTKGRRNIKRSIYVPFNGKLSTEMDNPYYSPYGSSNVLIQIDSNYPTLGYTEQPDRSVRFIDNDNTHNFNNTDELDDIKTGTFHTHVDNPFAVYRYGSLKKDNSSQYGTLNGLEYNPTDLVIANPTINNTGLVTTMVKGLIGDSWIDMFTVKRVRYASRANYTFCNLPEISVGLTCFFTESQLNTRLRYAEDIDDKYYFPKVALRINIKEALDYGLNQSIVTSDNYFKENIDFSKEVSKKNYGISELDIDLAGVIEYPTRILYSERLLDESRVDSYRLLLANNYRDLSKNKGSITHLFTKQQELYAITRDSLWKLFATNDNIKTEAGNTLAVGTGEFLSLEPVEVASIEGGYAGSSSKLGLVETIYGYLFVDRYKGKFILFDGSMKDISIKDVDNFISENYKLLDNIDSEFDNPLNNSGYILGYDNELKRFLITKLDYTLTQEQLENYKGIFNPNTTYQSGDIYLKDGKYRVFNSSSEQYSTIEENSNLSSFSNGLVDPINFSYTQPLHGVNINGTTGMMIYSPEEDYVGEDSFNISINCDTNTVNINVSDTPGESVVHFVNQFSKPFIVNESYIVNSLKSRDLILVGLPNAAIIRVNGYPTTEGVYMYTFDPTTYNKDDPDTYNQVPIMGYMTTNTATLNNGYYVFMKVGGPPDYNV